MRLQLYSTEQSETIKCTSGGAEWVYKLYTLWVDPHCSEFLELLVSSIRLDAAIHGTDPVRTSPHKIGKVNIALYGQLDSESNMITGIIVRSKGNMYNTEVTDRMAAPNLMHHHPRLFSSGYTLQSENTIGWISTSHLSWTTNSNYWGPRWPIAMEWIQIEAHAMAYNDGFLKYYGWLLVCRWDSDDPQGYQRMNYLGTLWRPADSNGNYSVNRFDWYDYPQVSMDGYWVVTKSQLGGARKSFGCQTVLISHGNYMIC